VLTIDQEYQTILFEELLKAFTETKAEKAMGIVIDPNTGNILAMANIPAFNSNNPSDYPISAQRNAVVSDIFEPGSNFQGHYCDCQRLRIKFCNPAVKSIAIPATSRSPIALSATTTDTVF
jgi:cell division protein FtsI/penicillin-binding protein 2